MYLSVTSLDPLFWADATHHNYRHAIRLLYQYQLAGPPSSAQARSQQRRGRLNAQPVIESMGKVTPGMGNNSQVAASLDTGHAIMGLPHWLPSLQCGHSTDTLSPVEGHPMRRQTRISTFGGRRAGVTVMALVALLLAIPTAVMDTHLPSRPLSLVPPQFDHFLEAVRAATPSNARVLVLNTYSDPHRYMYYRCMYMLYPREVIIQRVAPTDVHAGRVTMTWAYVWYVARKQLARYVLLWSRPAPRLGRNVQDPWEWSLPTPPRGTLSRATVQVRDGWGALVYMTW
jgi:hypothetical protein